MAPSDGRYGVGVVTDRAARGAVYDGHGPRAIYDEASDATYVAYRGARRRQTVGWSAPRRVRTS